ncbi:MAG: DUF1735 domain-containing protein [Candidatus Cryptobacteroides sp.]
MKKILLTLLCIPLLFSCFKDDQKMEYAKIYFPLAARAVNGVFNASFNMDADTSFIVGAYCAGSIFTPVDVDVEIALAEEEFAASKAGNASLAAYELLPEDLYEIEPSNLKLTIKAGTERADLRVHFKTGMFEAGKKYVLPLKLVSVSKYEIADQYNVLYFGVTAN